MSKTVVVERVSPAQWDALVPGFRDRSYRQCGSYANEAAKRVGAASELNRILTDGRELIGLAEVRIKRAPLTPWGIAYANYAPMTMRDDRFSERDFGHCLDALCKEYVERRGLVLRVIPPQNGGCFQQMQARCLESRGFRPGLPQPQKTILLDLATSIEQIRHNLDPKWRHSLVKAERNELAITRSIETEDFDAFNAIFLECANRKGFMPSQNVEFFKRVQMHAPAGQKMVLHLAWAHGKVIAGHLGSYIGDTATYLLGAADLSGRALEASFLLQWSAISYAKAVGNHFYDVGGVDEQGNPGVYRFKRRLNGRPLTELAPYELAPDPVSRGMIRLAETARAAAHHKAFMHLRKHG